MNNLKFINSYQKQFQKLIKVNKSDKAKIIQIFKILNKINQDAKKVLIFGNGGSAAIASHASVDLTKNANIRCVNFNESDLITCFSNDYGYSRWMEKSVDFYGEEGDVLMLVSASGKSPNVLKAVKAARKKKFKKIITFSRFSKKNPLKQLGDINIWVNSKNYNLVENTHQFIILLIVDLAINQMKKK